MADRFIRLHEINVRTDGTVVDHNKTALVNTSTISYVASPALADGSRALSVHCSKGGKSWKLLARAVDPYGCELPERHDHDRDDVLRYALRYLNGDR